MKTIKKLFIAAVAVFSVQYAQAQSSMLKNPVSFKLSNGITVVVAENPGTNKVYSNFTIHHNSAAKNNKAGIQDLLNVMLNETASQVEAGVSFDDKGGNLASLYTDFGKALSVMSASVKTPALNQQSFEKAKKNVMTHLKAQDRYYPAALNEDTLQQLTLADVKAFYNETIIPSKAYLTIAGNISSAEAKVLAKKEFGNWK